MLYGGHCFVDLEVPSDDSTTGIENSDFHFYITHTSEADQNFVAWAGSCSRDDNIPNFGRVNYNMFYVADQIAAEEHAADGHIDFEEVYETTIHEMMHAFGFDGAYHLWINPDTGDIYGEGAAPTVTETLRGKDTLVLTTSHVLDAVKTHFGCETATGA